MAKAVFADARYGAFMLRTAEYIEQPARTAYSETRYRTVRESTERESPRLVL